MRGWLFEVAAVKGSSANEALKAVYSSEYSKFPMSREAYWRSRISWDAEIEGSLVEERERGVELRETGKEMWREIEVNRCS